MVNRSFCCEPVLRASCILQCLIFIASKQMGGNKYKQSSTRHRTSKKRKFVGNRFTIHEDDDPTSATTTTTSTGKTAETEGNTSASASKINLSFDKNLKEDENNKDTSNMYMFMDIQILLDLIQLVESAQSARTN